MRRLAAGVAAVLLLLALPGIAEAKRVRVFTVSPKFGLDWVESRETFRAKLRAMADAEQRGPSAPLVQSGLGDVRSRLLGPDDPKRPAETARDLVTLPEDLGLLAAFTGARGQTARSATDLTSSIAGLIGSYGPVNAYYSAKFPELGTRPFPPTRLLATALTDTFVRVGVESFAELADDLDAYVVAGVTLVQDWQVVCVSKALYEPPPGAGECDVQDPSRVAALRAPDEPSRTYAYEATTPRPSTMALVFDPTGKMVAKTVKAYLTPVELPGQLDLVPGEVSGVDAIRTPVGTLGIVTSKDAWMPDVTTKLDQREVDVLVQPEFFVGDTVRREGVWSPDTLVSSGPADVLRHPSIQVLALPELVGNLFDFSSDSQAAVLVKPRGPRGPVGGFVGQPAQPGWAAVSPWVVPDPLPEDTTITARRQRLGAEGEKLLPGGPPCPDPAEPGPCEGGMVESVLFADVNVGERPARRPQRRKRTGPAPFGPSRPLARSTAPQRSVDLAARGRLVVSAFEQDGAVLVARSTDGGRRWSRGVAVPRQGTARQTTPSVAIGPDRAVWVAWQDGARVRWARSGDRGRTFGAASGAPSTRPDGAVQWVPSIAATGPGRAVLAWIDEGARFASDGLPQAQLLLTRLTAAGGASGPERLDRRTGVAPLAASLDHAWAPDVAARGDRVLVSWVDFRTYDWRVASRLSGDGGASFGEERQLTDVPVELESLADSPAVALGAGGASWVAWTNWQKDPQSNVRPSRLYDAVLRDAARDTAAPTQVDGHGDRFASAFSPAVALLRDGTPVVAFQDAAGTSADVGVSVARRATSGPASAVPRAPLRGDDAGRAGWNAWRPAIAATGSHVVLAWEDDRDGPRQVFYARAREGALHHAATVPRSPR